MTSGIDNSQQPTFRMRCSAYVQTLRKNRELTQERLAELAGFHRAYVSHFERGVQNMSLDTVERLRAALGVIGEEEASIFKERFAATLKEWRAERGLSQEELGFAAGVHRTYVSQVERCKTNISLDNIERLAIALELDPDELVGFSTKI